MLKPIFRFVAHPKLTNPVFVEGLPGIGNVGKIAARLFIEFTRASIFVNLYSPSFPDYVLVNNDGICRPPRYNFYSARLGKRSFLVMTGDAQPSSDDVVVHYTLCSEILDFLEQQNCKFIVTMGGLSTPTQTNDIYVAATSSQLAAKTVKKGAILYSGGKIMGAAGLLLGLAKERGLEGVCLLGATPGVGPNREAAFSVFRFLLKMFDVETNLNGLKKQF